MNYILSFWGLLVDRLDFWEIWRSVLGRSDFVNEISHFVNEVNMAGFEIPLKAVARIFASKTGKNPTELIRRFIEKTMSQLTPKPCVIDFLRSIKGDGKVAILSNTPCRCFIELFLSKWSVEADLVITSDIILRRKPSRAVFKYALRRLGTEPHEVIYIGDSEEDLGAMGVGLFTIIVGSYGGHVNFPSLCELQNWLIENLGKN